MAGRAQNLNIQILRAAAAVLVVIGHSAHETLDMATRLGRTPAELPLYNWGFGVDIFFVISGFIMVYMSADEFGRPGAPGTFLARRFARVAPIYWLVTTVLIVGALFAPRLLNVPIGDWQHVLASYLFIPSLRAPGEIRPVMALGWTLNFEMFFYVLFAGAMTQSFRRGMLVLTLVFLGLAAYGLAMRPAQVQLAFWTQSVILEFLLGAFLAIAYAKGVRLTASAAALIALLGFAGAIRIGGPGGEPAWPEVLRWGVPAALVVAAAALWPSMRASRPAIALAALGDASYSLYLVHPFVLRPLREIWTRLVGDALPLEAYIACATLLSVLASVAVLAAVERPMTRWIQARMRRSGPRARRTVRETWPAQGLRDAPGTGSAV